MPKGTTTANVKAKKAQLIAEEAEKMNKARRTIIMPRSNSKPLGKIHIMPKATTANVKAKKAQLISDEKKAAKQRLKEADKNIKKDAHCWQGQIQESTHYAQRSHKQ